MKFAVLFLALVARLAMPVAGAPESRPETTMFDLVSDPLLGEVIYGRVNSRKLDKNSDGAAPSSREWLSGANKHWAIEYQRGGGTLILAGVLHHDHDLVDTGLRIFEWGFQRQDPATGGFAESDDPFHSTSVFLMEVCRALLVLTEKSAEFDQEMPRVKAMIPHVRAAAQWFLRPEVLGPGKQKDQPFTHRRWLLAFCLGATANLSGDRELAVAAVDFAREGIALQQEDGINLERGGYDVSYQMVDAMVASAYYTTLSRDDSADLRAQIERMLEKTCRWEMGRLLPDGRIDDTGSTRMGKDRQHDGNFKHTNYPELIQAFSYAARVCQQPEFAEAAKRIAHAPGVSER